jgi:hypothetical protein
VAFVAWVVDLWVAVDGDGGLAGGWGVGGGLGAKWNASAATGYVNQKTPLNFCPC